MQRPFAMAEARASSVWFAHRHRVPSPRLHLLCLPHAGGGAALFRLWYARLPVTVEVWPVQLPGRETRLDEAALSTMDGVVEPLVEAVEREVPGPVAIFGHSMGALIGFELARALVSRGRVPVRGLFAAGRNGPESPPLPPLLSHLGDAAFRQGLRGYAGTPEELLQHEELMELVLPRLRSDFAVVENYRYRPGPPLPCPLHVFTGKQDSRVTPEGLREWHRHTRADFALHELPGDHFFVQKRERDFLPLLADQLRHLPASPGERR